MYKSYLFQSGGKYLLKIFMMFAVFMAMSSGLYGTAPTLSYSTYDANDDGSVDYIKVDVSDYDAYFHKTSSRSFKDMFAVYTNTADAIDIAISNIYRDGFTVMTNSIKTTIDKGTSIYLRLDTPSTDTGVKYRISYYPPHNNYISGTEGDKADELSKATNYITTDKVKPIITSVIADRDTDNKITILFSEAIDNAITNSSNAKNSFVIETVDNSAVTVKNVFNGSISSALTNGSKTLTLTLSNTHGSDELAKFKSDDKIILSTAASLTYLKDKASSPNIAKVSQLMSPIAITDSIPSITDATINLMTNKVTVTFNEKIVTNDSTSILGNKINVAYGSSSDSYNIQAAPTISTSERAIEVVLSGNDLNELKKRLTPSVVNNGNIIVTMNSGNINITDQSKQNDITTTTTTTTTASYTADNTAPTLTGMSFSFPKTINLIFDEPVTILHALTDWNSNANGNTYFRYGTGTHIPVVGTISPNTLNTEYAFIFDNDLTAQSKVEAIIPVGKFANYTGMPSTVNYVHTEITTSANNMLINIDNTAPTIKEYTLDMEEGEIVVYFETTVDSDEKIKAGFTLDKITLTKSDDEDLNLSSGSLSDTSLSSDNKEIIITLNTQDHNKIREFLGSNVAFSGTELKLTVDANNLKSNYEIPITDAIVNLKNDDTGSFVNGFKKDTTAPTISKWKLDLDDQVMKVYFDIPITGTLASNTLTISKTSAIGNGADTFGTDNAITIGDNDDNGTITIKNDPDNSESIMSLMEIKLTDKFIKDILNDRSLAHNSATSFLTILASSGITNINGENPVVALSGNNAINIDANPTATKGNVNILFTRNNGVNFLTSNTIPASYEINDSKWYLQTIPAGIAVPSTNINQSAFFDRIWEHNYIDSTWKNTNFTLLSTKGYWIHSTRQGMALIRARLDSTKLQENMGAFETRIKGLTANKYALIGVTNNISRQRLSEWPASSLCVVYIHAYKPSTDATAVKWDKDSGSTINDFKIGDAIWVKQNCNNSGTRPLAQVLTTN